ncbi:(S)-3-O-geranylgeranylglyceryl phosphate synthase [Gracilibacillus boraciitolerans JCM 21714]|uniref:Heptaprenylglyceryl phosphate synthase n=1 Tax=Gracilibacillus boraciitolerans JCM 21714 TaxID=1298598 RepID=W4VGL3_9BACI|nr:heptaprenylglyceryl phosphate synthase [Gracilibacillus boraciitolerans]GAE92306.1 (S)-3-O-geranylgeranylglyceryl phosphate synthase [Gracilibacillus boraciitolerans JCM 21714]
MYNIDEWKHIFKLDPAKEISEDMIDKICESGTDAIIVGGTDHVTLDDVLQLLSSIRRHTVPVILEISNIESVTPGFDYYFVPMVLNSQQKKWMIDVQHEAIREYGDIVNWQEMYAEGYCIMNEQSKVFQHTDCKLPTEGGDAIAYARMAEHLFRLPFFYLEYSGTYGDSALTEKISRELDNTKLIYGGGIESKEQAAEMSQYADIIVVGNVIYNNPKEALKTVKATK